MFWKKKFDISLGWEARDERIEDYSIHFQVSSVKAESKSNPYKYTEGQVDSGISYTGTIVNNGELEGKTLKVTIPDYEIDNIKSGDSLKLAVINDNTCIGVEKY